MNLTNTKAPHLGNQIPEPPGQVPARNDQATEQSEDQPVHFSHRFGRAIIALSVAPIPVVAQLLRLVVRPVTAELQRRTNREILALPAGKETQKLLVQRSRTLCNRSMAESTRLNAAPDLSWHQRASLFNSLSVPLLLGYLALPTLLYSLAIPTNPALITTPALIGRLIPGLTIMTLFNMGFVRGIEKFNAWRDRIHAQDTGDQSIYFSDQATWLENRETMEKLQQEKRQYKAENEALRLENEHLKKQLGLIET